ncbi:MAG TPA: sulfotransferase [Anaerolineae bacterium]|nr:sulfotransferase [Anaerolineae bacterium]
MSVAVHAPETSVKTRYIFIVGASRSGTTLMRRTLNRSDQIAICRENHFLGHWLASEGARHKFRQFGDLSNDANARRLVDYIYSGAFAKSSAFRGVSSQWHWLTAHVDQAEFLRRLLASERSARALFTLLMQVYAEYRGGSILGEKTPAHVRYVPTLLDWYPDGRIIHMLRDPRATFVSELHRRKKQAVTTPYKQLRRIGFLFKLFILAQTTLAWAESASRYFKYRQRYPDRYTLMKFEDLVTHPERNIRRLCDFLGADFQASMLRQHVVSQGFQHGQIGFDAQAADRWKTLIDPWIDRWFVFWFGKYLRELGYLDGRNGAQP